MPRVKVTTSTLPYSGSLEAVTWTAADAANGHYTTDDGLSVLALRNNDAQPKTVTIVSAPDSRLRRVGDVQIVVPAASGGVASVAFFGLHPADGWRQPGTQDVNINVSNATGLSLAAIRVLKG
jgi:hypothetical protein